jgi:LPXTG-motif cell wall-anchored protein
MKAVRVRLAAAVVTVLSVTGVATAVHAEPDEGAPPAATEAPSVTMTVTVQTAPAEDPPATDPPPAAAATDDDGAATASAESPDTTAAPGTTEATDPADTAATDPTSTDGNDGTAAPTAVAANTDSTTTTANPVQHVADQQTVVTGTQVAASQTGGNVLQDDRPAQPAGTTPGADITSGGATAVGSRDQNAVAQQAQLDLADQAVANLLQVALILNVGAALANSGVNGITAAPGGSGVSGAIGTGDATAVGNDSRQYVTQAARAAGDENTDSSVDQLAVSLNVGVAQAGSGVNAVIGTGVAGTGGSIGSGDATAVGNDAVTGILQQAAISGSGTSQLDIVQRATVLNLGFALANSGLNDVTGVAGQLLSAGNDQSDAVARDLFAMLLPAMLSSYAGTGGQGSIASGDATAIGNHSSTYVAQIAQAAASGDGVARIVQEVLVANVGAAGANSGGNSVGGAYASLDPQTAGAAITLAAFLSSMLALVDTNASNALAASQRSGLTVPFGDLVFEISGELESLDTSVGAGGTRANVRQVTVIVSLGVARANSGLNATVSVGSGSAASDDAALASADAPAAAAAALPGAASRALESSAVISHSVDAINTGDAAATNHSLTIICQRVQSDDVKCLAPPTTTVPDEPATPPTQVQAATPTTPPPPTTATTVPAPGSPADPPAGLRTPTRRPTATPSPGALPTTGSDSGDVVVIAAGLVLLGGICLLLQRRRRPVR